MLDMQNLSRLDASARGFSSFHISPSSRFVRSSLTRRRGTPGGSLIRGRHFLGDFRFFFLLSLRPVFFYTLDVPALVGSFDFALFPLSIYYLLSSDPRLTLSADCCL